MKRRKVLQVLLSASRKLNVIHAGILSQPANTVNLAAFPDPFCGAWRRPFSTLCLTQERTRKLELLATEAFADLCQEVDRMFAAGANQPLELSISLQSD